MGLVRQILFSLSLVAIHAQTMDAQTLLPPEFRDSVVLQGLTAPTAVAFSPDGRVFVAEKGGLIKVFVHLGDTMPAVFADLRTEVNDFFERGIMGLALDPAFPERPWVYVLYTRDAPPGGDTPTWGQAGTDGDSCPDPGNGCLATGRLARLEAAGSVWTGRIDVLVNGWTQQFGSHSIGALVFGPDGSLYASGGEGASWQFVDYGQTGSPLNPAGDPPAGVGGVMMPPFAEGGALRAQDLRTAGDPTGLSGTVIRIDPSTGEGLPDNPLGYHPDPNARRIVAYGFRNPFRMAVRPGTSQVWVGDVGWRIAEEINVLPAPGTGALPNFGWPCYEGGAPQPGYQAAGLALCEQLYQEPGAVTLPYFQYARGGFAAPGDESCGNTNASLSGLAFYEGGSYPEEYRGVLFLADYTRRCIWTMHPGPDGTPSAADVRPFASSAAYPVDLKLGFGGDVFYVDVVGGTVHRIEYRPTTPRAKLRISPADGPAPLTVQFDGQESTDPEGATLAFEWDIDGDGTFEPGGMTRSHVFTSDGVYNVRLRVTNDAGRFDVASGEVIVGAVTPTAVIAAPAANLLWRAGQSYDFSGSATDPQEGLLGPERLDWRLVMHHCSAPADCHEHTLQTYSGVATGSFVAPEHEYPSYITLELVATDRDGRQHRVERRIDPQPVQVVMKTEPAGLRVALGDEVLVSGESRTLIAGSRQTVSATSPQALQGVTYVFSSWSDGEAQSHLVLFHADTTLTARFVPVGSLPAEWAASDIGDVGLSGNATAANDVFTLRGAGDDVWNTADAFHYAWRTLRGNGAMTARVASFDGVDPWSKAGIMIRGSLAPDAAHAFLMLTTANGAAFQRRTSIGAVTTHTAVASHTWLRLERAGNLVTASVSSDGVTWAIVAHDIVELPEDVLVGLAVTSHDRMRMASATFGSVAVAALPAPSSDGTEVPPSSHIIDAAHGRWTIGDGGALLRDGIHVGGGYGLSLLWTGGTLYAYAWDGQWWRWVGTGWMLHGPTRPATGGNETSRDGTAVPPAGEVIDATHALWTLGANGETLRDGIHAGGGYGRSLLWTGGTLYAYAWDDRWWQWAGTGWMVYGSTSPLMGQGP